MRYLRDILVALACTVLIVGITMNEVPLALENRSEMIGNQTKNIQGIPEEIQGVWIDDSSKKNFILRGNQMIQSDEEHGTVYYTIHSTQIERNFETATIEDNASRQLYVLTIDLADYKMRYGEEEAASLAGETFYLVQDSDTEELITQSGNYLSRDRQTEVAYIIQDELVSNQPINRELLQKVDLNFLLESYDKHQEAGNVPLLENVYWDIAREYEDLGLLKITDYQVYQELSQNIINHSDLTYSRMNQADPKLVLELYQQAELESENVDLTKTIVESIYPDIEAAIQSYHNRQLTYENSLKFHERSLEGQSSTL
ncbi:hypothetical protein ACF3NG_11385 [Aerococcaceae bacterium WGS1372]